MDNGKPANLQRPLKVVFIHCGFIYSGGGERIVLEEAKGLIKRGYKVEVYAPTVDYQKCFPEFLKELDVKMLLPSFTERLPYRNAIRMVVSSLLAPVLAFWFRDADILIGANQPGIWIAFCAAKILGKPYIAYLNQPNRVIYPRPVDVEYGWYTTNKDYHILYRILKIGGTLLRFLDRESISHADSVLTNGGYIGSVIQNVYSVKTVDAPAGSYYQSLRDIFRKKNLLYKGSVIISGAEIKKPYILITNRHDPQKRFDYVIKAFAEVLKKYSKVNLVIPGPFTEHTATLVKLVKKLKIAGKVHFTKVISENDLQKLYKNACIYCYPSPQEDFGLGPLEAGGWGVPTVAWNHAGPTITVENAKTGYLAQPFEIKDYARCILKILENGKLRLKLGLSAWRRTKNIFSWDRHIDVLEKEIRKNIV
jgi:glycosyltransferase involved in cell wall biosynthesis